MTAPITNLGYTFDATQHEPSSTPKPLPSGWYNGVITSGEVKAAKSGNNNGYIELKIKVLPGPYDAKFVERVITDRINLWNSNPQTVEIANGTVSAICHAIGVFQFNDLMQLCGRPLSFRVVEKPAEGQYDASNDVKGYRPHEQQGAAGTMPGAPAGPPAAGAMPAAPPWGGGSDAPPPPPPAAAAPGGPPAGWGGPPAPPAEQPAPPAPPAAGGAPRPPWQQ